MEENHKDKGKRYKVMAGIDQVFSDSFTSKKIFGNDGFQFRSCRNIGVHDNKVEYLNRKRRINKYS